LILISEVSFTTNNKGEFSATFPGFDEKKPFRLLQVEGRSPNAPTTIAGPHISFRIVSNGLEIATALYASNNLGRWSPRHPVFHHAAHPSGGDLNKAALDYLLARPPVILHLKAFNAGDNSAAPKLTGTIAIYYDYG
jgi:hypothetical protein